MQRLTVMLSPRDHAGHGSLATEILSRARRKGMAGATVLQAVEGRGRSGALHRDHLFRDDAPLSIVVVDSEATIRQLLEDIGGIIGDALVFVQDVEAWRV